MKWSETFIPTMKEAPREAEVASHKLMLRCGMVQSLSSGLYIYLPLGYRVIEKIKDHIRAILNKHGAIELNMPALQPKAIWEKSGRWETLADLMMKIKDREDREFVLGPTHEEIITDLVAKRVNSYKELPLNFYQIQTKFRDEIRPRFGVIRAKEFIMKDGYSFDIDMESCLKSYERMVAAYHEIFRKLGLDIRAVEADTGAMGDNGRSHEFIAQSPIGEDLIARCNDCGYAANVEMAGRSLSEETLELHEGEPFKKVSTPNMKTIEEVSKFLDLSPSDLVKTILYEVDNEITAVLIRGDLEVNDIKLKYGLKAKEVRLAEPHQVKDVTKASVGFAGPIGLDQKVKIVSDLSIRNMTQFVVGANEDDFHYTQVNWNRDFNPGQFLDLSLVQAGDRCPKCSKGILDTQRGIEVGHVFILGKKYSEAMGAKVMDSAGKEVILDMGCYGIGVSRLVASIIEAHHDDKGIAWPVNAAPFEVVLCALDMNDDEVREASLRIYEALKEKNVDVLLDDRKERPGIKFADAELIGIPYRVTIGKRSLSKGLVEFIERKTLSKEEVLFEDITEHITSKIKAAKEALE